MLKLIAQIPAPTPGSTENFLWIFGALGFIAAVWVGLYFKLRPKPHNETLGVNVKSLSQRIYTVEGSVRKLHARIDGVKDQFTEALQEQTESLNASGERRSREIGAKFEEIMAALARLDERSKNQK